MSRAIQVLIVDDHAVVREGLKMILAPEDDIEVVGEAADGAHAVEALRHRDCDVVLLDISLPGRSGLDVLRHIRSVSPGTRALMLSIHPEEQYAVRSLRAGASGYMTKETAPSELVSAVRKVAGGGRYISSSLAEALVMELDKSDGEDLHSQLSDREYEVLRLIGSGLTSSQIAERLNLSVKTVSTYRTRLLEKMNLSTNAEIMRYAVSHGLVD